jgi:hypothetical protein
LSSGAVSRFWTNNFAAFDLAPRLHIKRNMMKAIVTTLMLAVAACASNPPPSLTGTWTGTATNNSTTSYTFRSDGTFEYDAIADGATTSLAAGTFHNDYGTLTIDAAVTNPETGENSTTEMQFQSYYASGTSFCDAGYQAESASMGSVVGSWQSSVESQPIDANGNSSGAPSLDARSLSLAEDDTFSMSTDAGTQTGTYTLSGTKLTTTIANNNVESIENFTLIDGLELCDPVFTKQP